MQGPQLRRVQRLCAMFRPGVSARRFKSQQIGAVEMFRSPADAGTTYLPYIALVTIAAVTRTDEFVPESALEQM